MLTKLLHFLFPQQCLHCHKIIEQKFLCDECFKTIKFTDDHLYPTSSQCYVRLVGELGIKMGMSMCFFNKETAIQSLMHCLKYGKKPKIGTWIGRMYGEKLLNYHFEKDFDLMIPIPLHKDRLRARGYNQSAMFAKGLSDILNIPVEEKAVIRTRNTVSQTTKPRAERFENVKGAFAVITPNKIKGKNILLIDDTITTGATLMSCGKEILKYQPKSLSVVTICVAVD